MSDSPQTKKTGEERLNLKSAMNNAAAENLAGANTAKPDVKVQTEIDKKDASTKTQPEASKETSSAKVQFKSDNIGRWASKQENPFAEQNRKTAAKKQQQAEQRKKAAPFVVVIVSIVAVVAAIGGLVGLVIWLVNSLPKPEVIEITGSTAQDITDYQNILLKFYNQNPSATPEERVQNIQKIVDGTLSSESGKNNADAVLYAQFYVYVNEGLDQEVIEVGKKINLDNLDNQLKAGVCGALGNAYYALGDLEAADAYYQLLSTIPIAEE